MEILVIEDNDLKYDLVLDCLKEIDNAITSLRAASYQSAIEMLTAKLYDYVILDMTLPVYDGTYSLVGIEVLTFGGEMVLRETLRKGFKSKFIVLSQYDTFIRGQKEVGFAQLREELLNGFGGIVLDCIQLDSTSVSWKNQIETLIRPQK